MSNNEDHSGIRLGDVRSGLGQVIEDARAAGWQATRREDGRGLIPVDWLSDHVGRLEELDRGLAAIERLTGPMALR
jgi:hypothetical protein